MHLTHFGAIMTVLGSLVVAASVIAAGLRWIYQQGVSSARSSSTRIDINTSATDKLSSTFERFSERTGPAPLPPVPGARAAPGSAW